MNNGKLLDNADVFRQLMDYFPDMIQSVDYDGRVIYVNRKVQQLLGYTQEEYTGLSIEELYSEEIIDDVKKGFLKLREEGNLFVCESILLNKKQEKIPVEIRSFAVYDADGNFLKTFSIVRDIREVKQLQSNLIHAGRLAAIGELASCIIHDIGNPLTVAKFAGELLGVHLPAMSNALDEEDLADLTKHINNQKKAINTIEKLVNHLRILSRTNEAKTQSVSIVNSINDALFMVQNKVSKGRITVNKIFPDETIWIDGHSTQLEQLFMNLFSNACDALAGVEDPEITVTVTKLDDSEVSVKVQDNGCGIPDEIRENIFNSFFTTKEAGKGTGLGLSIVDGIVKDHKGNICVDSPQNGGTVFSLSLPIMDNPAAGLIIG